jgi:hypothetical protein
VRIGLSTLNYAGILVENRELRIEGVIRRVVLSGHRVHVGL